MSRSAFVNKLESRWKKGLFVSVGLDSDYEKIPQVLKKSSDDIAGVIEKFNCEIIDATSSAACVYKINSAFYEGFGLEGMTAMEKTFKYLKTRHPDVVTILDFKRADIGNTNLGYAKLAFDVLGADSVTVNPYLGGESLGPFLEFEEKGIFVLCKTSNPGSGEIQDLPVEGEPLYKTVAKKVAHGWNKRGNCALVVGATYHKELSDIREIAGEMPILIPGIGAQGGDLEATVKAAKDRNGNGFIVSSSRGIIFASEGSDFAEAARAEVQKLTDEIDKYRGL